MFELAKTRSIEYNNVNKFALIDGINYATKKFRNLELEEFQSFEAKCSIFSLIDKMEVILVYRFPVRNDSVSLRSCSKSILDLVRERSQGQ